MTLEKQINSMVSNKRKRALIAMSGGVDSSVAAALMKEAGYDCVGAMMKLYRKEDIAAVSAGVEGTETDKEQEDGKTCCSAEDAEDAESVARKLDMPFYVFNFSEEFRCRVMERFVNAYLRGETPNPCIDCNHHMKFGKLYERARMLGCDKIVTGHYARISRNPENGRWQLRMAKDKSKDQSYVLYSLSQEQLSHVCFPLGELEKSEVRSLAEQYGFYNAAKKESQDICFVPDGHYEQFIERYLGKELPRGNFVAEDGRVLGKHKGIIHYTVGQRKGLGIAAAEPLYVKEIRPETQEVVLCSHESLFQDTLYAKDVNWLSIPEPAEEIYLQAKIRYRHTAQPGCARVLSDGRLMVKFDEPQRAITRGQAVVLYDGETVLGGGIICGSE